MKISINKKGGFTIDGKDCLILSDSNVFLDLRRKGLRDCSDFKNITGLYSARKNKAETLIAVIKWLFKD